MPYFWTSHFHDCPITMSTEYWCLFCCGHVCHPLGPLASFCTATVPVSQHYSGQCFQLLLSLYSSHGPGLAESQYLGRTPTCHHNDKLTHRSFMSNKSVQAPHPWIQIRTSYMRSFTPFSDRHVRLVSSPKKDQPGAPASLQAWYSCGMGPGVGHRLKGWQHLFSWHFDLCVIQIMFLHTEQKLLHK